MFWELIVVLGSLEDFGFFFLGLIVFSFCQIEVYLQSVKKIDD